MRCTRQLALLFIHPHGPVRPRRPPRARPRDGPRAAPLALRTPALRTPFAAHAPLGSLLAPTHTYTAVAYRRTRACAHHTDFTTPTTQTKRHSSPRHSS